LIARVGIAGQQRRRGHELAGLAVAALGHLLGDPGDLQRMAAGRIQALDGRDLLAGGLGYRRLARAYGLTVEVYRARAALRDAAAKLRAGQLEPLADHPQKRRARIDVNRLRLPVDQQCRHDASCALGGKPTIWWREPSTKSPPPASRAAARLDPERAHDLPGSGQERHRDEASDKSAEVEPGEQRDEHGQRVQAGGAAHEAWREQ